MLKTLDHRSRVWDPFHYFNKDLESLKKTYTHHSTHRGRSPLWEPRSLQVLFICQPAALETWKPVKDGPLDCGIAACEPIAGAHFILPLYLCFSIPLKEQNTDHQSHLQIYQTAHITCFHLSLPLKHCDNAEVDKATCTASSASTSLQTESIQDNRKLECLISWSVFNIYLFKVPWMVNLVRREDVMNLA